MTTIFDLTAPCFSYSIISTSSAHFTLKKFDSQMEKVPSGAPFHSWNVGVPKFEFGMMHAILFQLAVLPLAMCRLSVASLSDALLCRFLPFNSMTDYHIAIWYIFVIFVLATVSVSFMFFGVICNSGDDSFCRKVWSNNKFSNFNFRFTLHSLTCYFHVGYVVFVFFTSFYTTRSNTGYSTLFIT